VKASEALLRCIANEGGTIDGPQVDVWLGQLHKAGFLEKGPNFTWVLSDKAKVFLKQKGVTV
jgi:hypothetical protein